MILGLNSQGGVVKHSYIILGLNSQGGGVVKHSYMILGLNSQGGGGSKALLHNTRTEFSRGGGGGG